MNPQISEFPETECSAVDEDGRQDCIDSVQQINQIIATFNQSIDGFVSIENFDLSTKKAIDIAISNYDIIWNFFIEKSETFEYDGENRDLTKKIKGKFDQIFDQIRQFFNIYRKIPRFGAIFLSKQSFLLSTDVAQLYNDFIYGRSLIPSYPRSIDSGSYEDTENQLDLLQQVNDLSFMTMDSQDGLEESLYLERNKKFSVPKSLDQKDVLEGRRYQMAYVNGLIPTVIGLNLIEMIRESKEDFHFCLVSIKEKQSQKNFEGTYDPVDIERFKLKDGTIKEFSFTGAYCESGEESVGTADYNQFVNPLHLTSEIRNNFVNYYSSIHISDQKPNRQKYLTETLIKMLKGIFKNLKTTVEENSNILTSFNNKQLIDEIKTRYPELKVNFDDLTKRELCLILNYPEIHPDLDTFLINERNHLKSCQEERKKQHDDFNQRERELDKSIDKINEDLTLTEKERRKKIYELDSKVRSKFKEIYHFC